MFSFFCNVKVIGKLSEGKASHVPYRDSKLTRLLQSSLSGHGHVSVSIRNHLFHSLKFCRIFSFYIQHLTVSFYTLSIVGLRFYGWIC